MSQTNKSAKNYINLMDNQFNLLQEIINLSDYIIYQEYQDLELIKTGKKLLRKMLQVNRINYKLLKEYPEEETVEFISNQYQQYELDPLEKISEEVDNIKIILEETQKISENIHNTEEEIKAERIEDIKKIATYNLRDYENTLQNTFDKF